MRTDTMTARVLRYLQILDERLRNEKVDPEDRKILVLCEEILGEQLGLDCSSDDRDNHQGDTCPVHEWLVPGEDALVAGSKRPDAIEVLHARALDALREARPAGDTDRVVGLIDQLARAGK